MAADIYRFAKTNGKNASSKQKNTAKADGVYLIEVARDNGLYYFFSKPNFNSDKKMYQMMVRLKPAKPQESKSEPAPMTRRI